MIELQNKQNNYQKKKIKEYKCYKIYSEKIKLIYLNNNILKEKLNKNKMVSFIKEK